MLRGSALAYRQGILWWAVSTNAFNGTGRLWQVSEDRLMTPIADGGDAIEERAADRELPIATQTQGAAVAADGSLWLTLRNGRSGQLQRLEPGTGRVLASWPMSAGIEGIEFAADGILWTVSEAGSQRWNGWPSLLPVVSSLDVDALPPRP
jgi:hypothetical protein